MNLPTANNLTMSSREIALHKTPTKDNQHGLECSKCGEKFPF